MTRSTISPPWVKDFSISPCRMPCSSATHLPSPIYTIQLSPSFLPQSPEIWWDPQIHCQWHQHQSGRDRLDPAFTSGQVRSSVQLALCTFLASAAGNSHLTHHILPPHFQSTKFPIRWSSHQGVVNGSWRTSPPPPFGPASHRQKAWDNPSIMISSY